MPKAIQDWVLAFGQWLYDRNGGWAFDQPIPKVLYKYCVPKRVHVLRDCSVRFSQRAVFEDDRELRPEVAAFGTEEEIRAYMDFNPWGRSLPTGLRESVLRLILTVPGWQQKVLHSAMSGFTASDEFAVFCLCEESNSNEMWKAYAATKGFVLAFDTSHTAFESLRNPGKLGKITYSDEPLGTFIGSYGPDAFFRKRAKYAFEREWRIIRAIHRLENRGEQKGHAVLVSRFDPACVLEVLLRPESTVENKLRELFATDRRYEHIELRHVKLAE